MSRSRNLTLLDLIEAVSEVAANEQEMLAAVADLINSGKVRLCGDAAGASIDLSATKDLPPWSIHGTNALCLRRETIIRYA
jgi:hypothetical protein